MFRFKQIALTFLSLAILMKAFVVPIICLDYELRKDFIIKNYCVNKNRPELHCDGKCFLAKKIDAQREQEQQNAFQNFVFKLLDVSSFELRNNFSFLNSCEFTLSTTPNFVFLENPTIDFQASIFHPPSLNF